MRCGIKPCAAFAALAGVLTLGASRPVAAFQAPPKVYPGDVAKRLRVHLDFRMAYWRGDVAYAPADGTFEYRTHALGVVGYPMTALAVGLGYAVSDRLLAGLRVDLSVLRAIEVSGPTPTTIVAGLSPYVQLFFARDKNVRPYLHLHAGLGGGGTYVFRRSPRDVQRIRGEASPVVGVGVGAHGFVTEDVSVDAMLLYEHRWDFRTPTRGTEPDAPPPPREYSFDGMTTSFAAILGVSRWF